MDDKSIKKKPNQQRFPENVTDRLDRKGDKLGVLMAPGALLRVDLGLTADEILFCLALHDHYRGPGDRPNPSYVRVGLMLGRDRKGVAATAERLDKRGVVPRTKYRRGYKHDLAPLLAKMATDPLKEFPSFADERLWDRDQKIAMLIAENAALRKGLLAPTEPETTPGEGNASISEPIVIEDFKVTAAEVWEALDHWLFSAEGREYYPHFIGRPDLTDEDVLDAVKKKNTETPHLSKEHLLKSATFGLYWDRLKAKGVKIRGENDLAPLADKPRAGGLADQDPDDFIAEFGEPASHQSPGSAASGNRGVPGAENAAD